MDRLLIVLVCFILWASSAFGQEPLVYPFASKDQRVLTTNKLKTKIDSLVTVKADPKKFNLQWQEAFWAMELMRYKQENFVEQIPGMIDQLPALDAEFQRAFLEMLYGLYPSTFAPAVQQVWEKLANAKNQAMALEYLAQVGIKPKIKSTHKIHGTGWHQAYHHRWMEPAESLPKKADFQAANFIPGQYVLCSFQSKDRNQPGYLMIRTPEGRWLTDPMGKPYQFTQLARSLSNLPSYLTNGNTPQGLFKVTGTGIASDAWIGPVPSLLIFMPFEGSQFFGKETAPKAFYEQLLGPDLSPKKGLWQSYDSGKLGRYDIIAHGTTIDPEYYRGEPYYPCTPSLGCLCSPELWAEDGSLKMSTQKDWIKVLKPILDQLNWLIVAEVEDL